MIRWILVLWLGGATLGIARDLLVLQNFRFATPEAARTSWQAPPGGPAALTTPGKAGDPRDIMFPCNMRAKDRVYWDHNRKLNLSAHSSFEFELDCRQPDAIDKVMVYFKSGDGWYVASRPLTKVGFNKLIFSRSAFETEGKPGPWSRIERIRVAFTKGMPMDTMIMPRRILAIQDTVGILQATVSVKSSSDKQVARQCSERIGGWMQEYHISHGRYTDETLTDDVLKGLRVLILPYNPYPSASQTKRIEAFVRRGGRLVVCHASSERIAALMQVRQQKLINTQVAGRWNAMRFGVEDGFLPERIYQHVWNLVPVHPLPGKGKTIAHWESAERKVSNYPAVIRSNNGYWMTHVMYGGDQRSKKLLLLKMLGDLDAANWQLAAASRLSDSARVLGCNGLQEVIYLLRAQAERSPNPVRVQMFLGRIKDLDAEMRKAYAENRFTQAVVSGHRLRDEIEHAYAAAQQPAPAKELRGLWDQNGTGLHVGDWNRTCERLSALGFNAIFPNMVWSGKAHYDSKIVPKSKTYERFGDQVKQCLDAGNRHGIETHVWKICWKLENADPDFLKKMRAEKRLQLSRFGHEQAWLCPSDPRNQAHEVASVKELVSRYPVHGMHLDYARFPDSHSCFCPHCRKGFEHKRGKKVAKWPDEVVTGGPLRGAYESYRVAQINKSVEAMSRAVRETRKGVQVSVAVWPSYPDTLPGIAQDYGAWLKAGWVDFLTPMNYTNDPLKFDLWIRNQTSLSGGRGRILPGIGLISNEAELGVGDAIRQIQVARKRKCPGFLFFKLDHAAMEHVYPWLPLKPAAR